LFEKQPDPRLRGFLVWVPETGAEEKDVGVATRIVPDPRVQHYWDGDGLTIRGFQAVLGLPGDAWDVFMIYGPAASWEEELPPKPDYWMHQLQGVEPLAPRLDPDVFASQANQLLRQGQ
jgi:hypothetical protein